MNLILPQFGLPLHCFAKPWLRRKSWSREEGTFVSFTPGLTECKDCACRTHKVWRMRWENWHKKIGNMFCEQLCLSRYADIYTSRVSNFCRYSPFMYFRSQTQVRTPSYHAICHTILYFFILMHAHPEPQSSFFVISFVLVGPSLHVVFSGLCVVNCPLVGGDVSG